ncbi:MAG: protein-L-isoaspartate(D-aspartate) O-methyltransferase [archaeon]|nr:protein-L-isoaspartate(D-aspartate) O-methyltransferase [Candidatus Micrarchaeota archaeon]
MKEDAFTEKRKQLVYFMKASGAIESIELENAFLKLKREVFFPQHMKEQAYSDNAFPIGFNQTISQPSTIAIMMELLDVKKGMKVLEVGAGSGYVCALLEELVGEKGKVYGIELVKELFEQAKKNLEVNGSKNIELFLGDGSKGLEEKALFDRILVSAACPFIPKPLFEQLNEKGRAVAPVGDSFSQQMMIMEKIKDKPFNRDSMKGFFVFVPLKGAYLKN